MMKLNRRDFLKSSGLSVLPLCVPVVVTGMAKRSIEDIPVVNLISDGPGSNPADMLDKLQKINKKKAIEPDFYGYEGDMDELLEKFRVLTGKEKAVYMPSGTMANQLALKVLSGDNTKVFVQETSHVYRDEADAAQSLHGLRLIPLEVGAASFTLQSLQQAIAYHEEGEIFKSGIGAVSIESPVRRCDGSIFPLAEIRRIAAYCKEKGYKLHLDGARLPLATAFSGVRINEYASYFDTVFISLYKCVGAISGAVLCGDKQVMDRMDHLIKIHGGAIYRNWTNSALALHCLEGLEERLEETARRATELLRLLNALPDIKTIAHNNGSNVYGLMFDKRIDTGKLSGILRNEHHIVVSKKAVNGVVRIAFNETLLNRPVADIALAYELALAMSVK